MPTLGFLKKKRTREGNQDSQGGSSQPTSPVTPTSSKPFDSSISTTLSSLTSSPQHGLKQNHDSVSSETAKQQQQMYPVTVHPPNQSSAQQPYYNQQPGSQQNNIPSINNLINPTQQDASHNDHNYLAPQPSQSSRANPSPGTDPARLQQQQAQSLPHPSLQQQQQQQQFSMQQQAADQQVRQTKGKYTLADFDILRTLGTGSFGRVHLVQSKHNQRFYAVKVLKKAQVVKMKQVEHTNDERKMLGEVKHPFLITLWGTFQDSKNLYMVMDFVEGGELFSLLRKSGRFPNPVAKFYAAEVTLALEYMHSRNIIYRDLKPENLLLDRHGHLKITDFGFAKRVPDKTWTLCGTPDYLAPEVVSNKGYNKSVDWWSLGILIYEMLCGYTPFWDSGSPMKIYENILKGKVKYPAYINPDAQDLLEKLITADLTKRLGNLYAGPNDVKNHPWFAEVTWDRLARKDIDAPYTPPVKAGAGDASQFDRYPEDPERYGSAGHDEYGHLFTDF
ncbi:Pkinase-domain-containing protein [Colletotrichum zoysiae]|uniref:cAMP-dependent protein kinase n=1 Tax=Colletotrichum zoysiae TaxID=1216348 RepID=A0AAD9M2W3_9PEZI|nr:Pkinase-domain-containing protein [Colletotrichum zoysiae]